ncbi:MAG: BTAD domain-containing putative transcriptional regulator [Fimbriimonas sp.]|nr:BTAD domain-containing putative transcriptional regulator [Fimbriimonas sp.]
MSHLEPEILRQDPLKDGGFLLRMFGPMVLERGAKRQTKFPTKRSALLLARLAVARDRRVCRDELAEMLWPDDYLDLTRIRLRQELRRLRQAIDGLGCCLRSDRQWVEIEPGCLTTDVQAFDKALVCASVALTTASKIEYLNRAVALLGGPFLAGHQEPWVHATRRTYSEKARRAWLSLADAHQELGEHEKALDATINAVRHDPLDIDANGMLVRRLMERGQGARARQAFLEFDAMIFRELGYHAPASIRALLGVTGAESDESSLPMERISKSIALRPLPLFGRDDLLGSLECCLSRQGATVLVVGMVGVGKTHLIREAAWQFSRVNNLPVQFGGKPERISDGLYIVEEHLDRAALLKSIEVASSFGWRVLAESRMRIASGAFEEILVNPLPVPACSDVSPAVLNNPSVQILISQMAKPGAGKACASEIAPLAEIARRCDGLPTILRFFSSRLTIETPSHLAGQIEEGMHEFLNDPGLDGETFGATVHSIVSDLPSHAFEAVVSLSLLDGASIELAGTIGPAIENSDPWRVLERRSLVTVQAIGQSRRIRVPVAIAVAIQAFVEPHVMASLNARTWHTVADWTFTHSRRLTGPQQDQSFSEIHAELVNVRRGIDWAIDNDPELAAYLAVASWRTVCARGNPSADGEALYGAAKAGAHLLASGLDGEVWTGAGIALSIVGQTQRAEDAYQRAVEIYKKSNNRHLLAWNNMNYAVHIVVHSDKERALALLKEAAELTTNPDLRLLARSDYALVLASVGSVQQAVQVAEDVFAHRLASEDSTILARAYVDLGELYHFAGRHEAARPLLLEGIRRLRETGIQNMLLDQLVFFLHTGLDHGDSDETLNRQLLDEATEIATRIGVRKQLLAVARIRMAIASKSGDRCALIAAIDEMFRLTQGSSCAEERTASLRLLATELRRHGKIEYADAISCSLGEETQGQCHPGWRSLISSESHVTLCVLATVLAKEALNS